MWHGLSNIGPSEKEDKEDDEETALGSLARNSLMTEAQLPTWGS